MQISHLVEWIYIKLAVVNTGFYSSSLNSHLKLVLVLINNYKPGELQGMCFQLSGRWMCTDKYWTTADADTP